MRQLLLSGTHEAGETLELSGEDYHYLARVRRSVPGDRVPALDEAGNHWELLIQADDGTHLTAVLESADSPGSHAPGTSSRPDTAPLPEASARAAGSPRWRTELPPITVYQAIPKGRKLDEPLRQLVQAGVRRVVPVVTERTVVRPEQGATRMQRWRRIVREAVQQSGAPYPATVTEPVPLSGLTASPEALSLILHTEPIAQTTLHGYLADIPTAVELVVGPEGGFSSAEMEAMREAGFLSVWLGPQVLRSESAALFAVAALRILILERATWQPAEL